MNLNLLILLDEFFRINFNFVEEICSTTWFIHFFILDRY